MLPVWFVCPAECANLQLVIIDDLTIAAIAILGIQTVIFIALLVKKGHVHRSYRYLAVVLAFYLISLINIVVVKYLNDAGHTQWIPYLQLGLLFGFGPSIYIYARSISDREYRFSGWDILHYLPVVVEFIYYRTDLFRSGALPLHMPPATWGNYAFHLMQWGGMLSIMVYLIFTARLLKGHQQWLTHHFSNLSHRQLSWFRKPIFIYTIFWAGWLVMRIVDIHFYDDGLRDTYLSAGFIIISIITCWIGIMGYISSVTLTSGFLQAASSPGQPSVEELKPVMEKVRRLMEEQALYLDTDLKLKTLADLAGYPEKQVSRAINGEGGSNFHEFVNQYRIDSFKSKILDPNCQHLNLLGMALESGFGSKSTFNLVFKKMTGMTPRQYVENVSIKRS